VPEPAPQVPHHRIEKQLPVFALDAAQFQRFVQVRFVADGVGGQVGPGDPGLRQAVLDGWPDSFPLRYECLDRTVPPFLHVLMRPLMASCGVHSGGGDVGGTADEVREQLMNCPSGVAGTGTRS